MIRLLIADDHPLVRSALARLFGGLGDIEVIALAADGQEAVRLAGERLPDVILMDMKMPVQDGISAMRELRGVQSLVSVVMMSATLDLERTRAAIRAGAVGFILKDAEPADVLGSVRAAAAARASALTADRPARGTRRPITG